MKKILLLMTLVVTLSFTAWGAACPTAVLSVYDVSGFTCNISGTELNFSGFSYGPSGTPVPDSSVLVTPTVMGGEAGFLFNGGWTANNGETTDGFIQYSVACDGCSIDDWVLAIGGSGSTGNGSVNVAENSSSVTQGLTLTEVGGVITGLPTCGAVLGTCSGTFPPVGSLTVTKDVSVTGGSTPDTNSQVSAVTNLFSTTTTTMTPEPSLLIFCMGLAGLVPVVRRRLGH
jgi:hypothetical protein